MKFGKNLAAQQAKFPNLRYINFKDLKKVIKQDAKDAVFFDAQLHSEIDQVNACFSHHVAMIQAALANVGGGSVSTRLREVMAISQQVEMLRKFAVWNAVAVVKILKKRTKILAGPVPPGLLFGHTATMPASSSSSSSVPAETWLSKQLFFSGSDFAELQASLESLAGTIASERLAELSYSPALAAPAPDAADRCPICLERCVDAVELSSCGHRFCWKCVVLGPIAFAPGEYRLSRCSVCRNEQPLDPTRNFKTVCSNQLQFLSTLADSASSVGESLDGWADQFGLDELFGSASGARQTTRMQTEKERQAMDSLEGAGHPASSFFCSLCCEPLLLEAISTTPCKHHFHRVCLEKHGECFCPLCQEVLPIELVTPRYMRQRSPYIEAPVVPTRKEYVGPGGIIYRSFDKAKIDEKKKLASDFSL